jgi:hypothetical protein
VFELIVERVIVAVEFSTEIPPAGTPLAVLPTMTC